MVRRSIISALKGERVEKLRVGLLPLYLELYDEALPQMRAGVEEFAKKIETALVGKGLEVVPAPVCRLRDEFVRAVRRFEDSDVDATVTLHLGYSPSLESIDALAGTPLPLIVLDTTPDFEFGKESGQILYNHGIHGVQDLCNLLIRRGKAFEIEAGHWERSDVLDRIKSWAVSARIAHKFRTMRVGRVGLLSRVWETFVCLRMSFARPSVLR